MIIKFWGVRGSIPAPMGSPEIKAKILRALKGASSRNLSNEDAIERYVSGLPEYIAGTYGGNTSCVQLQAGNTTIIFDAGSGIRVLGMELMERNFGQGAGTAYIFLSHTHWDHIQGFPFFLPAYEPGNRIVVYAPHQDVQARLNTQQGPSYFPVSLEAMGADIEFVCLSEGETVTINDLRISNMRLKHPGGSFGYRVEKQELAFVYATDTALDDLSGSDQEEFVQFLSRAKVAVLDAQYTAEEPLTLQPWGHSSLHSAVDLGLQANVETLVLFHHEPALDDHALYERFQQACKYLDLKRQGQTCILIMAFEGLQLEV